MNADREAQHAMAEARQAVGADAQVSGIVAAIAQIRKAALAAAGLSSGAGWYLGGDLSGVLCDEDAALLVACEPVRLLEVLALADQALKLHSAHLVEGDGLLIKQAICASPWPTPDGYQDRAEALIKAFTLVNACPESER